MQARTTPTDNACLATASGQTAEQLSKLTIHEQEAVIDQGAWATPAIAASLFLRGVSDPSSPISMLDNNLIHLIWKHYRRTYQRARFEKALLQNDVIAFEHLGEGSFPEAHSDETRWLNVNMLPFRMCDLSTLPVECLGYEELIRKCLGSLTEEERQNVGYLTIHEGYVEPGTSQRRPGIHTDGFAVENFMQPDFPGKVRRQPWWHAWGFGSPLSKGVFEGGIFIASTVSDTTALWNVMIPTDLVGPGGDLSHLEDDLLEAARGPQYGWRPDNRQSSGEGEVYRKSRPIGNTSPAVKRKGGLQPTLLQENQLFWLTDRTPHESLPVEERTFRQFFRLVTSRIDRWYAAHSTSNPKCAPGAPIVHYNKFTGAESA